MLVRIIDITSKFRALYFVSPEIILPLNTLPRHWKASFALLARLLIITSHFSFAWYNTIPIVKLVYFLDSDVSSLKLIP